MCEETIHYFFGKEKRRTGAVFVARGSPLRFLWREAGRDGSVRWGYHHVPLDR
jgi:hypothetical protein